MKLVDVHCHLESKEYDDLATVIDKAKSVGIIKLITCAITPSQWEVSKNIASIYPEVEFAWGVHPWYISSADLDLIAGLSIAKEEGAVAIGEIGLDRVIDNPTFDTQLDIFEAQLRIAKEINLPVIMHCRKAFNEMAGSIKKIGLPEAGGIIHSFNGSVELAQELIDLGLSFSIGGILTQRNSKKREAMLKHIYPRYFLLETDSPDILPVQIKERPNLPEYITYNLKAASDILGLSEEVVAEVTTQNAQRIFSLQL